VPELPEVETIRRGLLPHLTGRRVAGVVVRERRLRRPVRPRDLAKLRGSTFTGVRRRGKYLLLDTDADATLLVHLGMTGRLFIASAALPARPHEHVVIALDDGRQLRFADSRRFGVVERVATERLERHPLLDRLGIEPLDDVLSGPALCAITRGRRRPVKNFLMDARTIAGIGNIYACEALHRAGVHPERAVGRIGPAAWARLVAAVRAVLREAIRAGGTTLRDFVNAGEEAGRFAVSLRVYDRAGAPCLTCGSRIRRIVLAGRSTFYCPACQK
jgi:formamidopyrimidine-DNA glycosylase